MRPTPTVVPVTGPALRRRLSAAIGPDEVRALLARSNRPGLNFLCAHLLLLVVGAVAILLTRHAAWIWAAWVLDGVCIAHLFALQHETAHATAFTGRRTNRVISTVCGGLLGIAPAFFRLEHTAHHAWTQDAARDPEMITVPPSIGRWLWFLIGVPFWSYQLATLAPHALGRLRAGESAFVPARSRRRVRAEAQLMLVGWAALVVVPLVLGTDAVFVYWLVPRVLGEPVMRLARLAEHTGRPSTGDATVDTRTLDVALPLRLLAWNMPYHAEHHAMPAVPFWSLPRLRVLLADHIDAPDGGYLAAQVEIVRAIRARQP